MTELSPGTSPPPVRIPIRRAAIGSPLEPAVRVEAPEEQVAAEIREEDGDEADHQDQRRGTSRPATLAAGMEVNRVDQPRDEGRCLLWIPAPVAAPGDCGPPAAEDDQRGEDREADDHRPVSHLVEHLR